MPLVSVIVPAYNYGRYLKQCLGSILGQRGFADLELLVIDDCSTDETPDVVKSFNDERIVYVRHKTNQGHLRGINEGFRLARGEYIAHVGADDFWHPDFLAQTVPLLQQHPQVGLVHTNYALVDADGKITVSRGTNIPFTDDFKGNELVYLLFENYLPPHGTLFRKEHLKLIGGQHCEEMPLSEDWRLWLAIGKHAEFYFVNQVLVYYRVHGENIHTMLARTRRGESSELLILDEFFADPGLDPNLLRLKPKVYAARFRRYADWYFGFGMMDDCRRCLVLAVRHDRAFLERFHFWKRLLGSFLPDPLYRSIKQVRSKLVRRRG